MLTLVVNLHNAVLEWDLKAVQPVFKHAPYLSSPGTAGNPEPILSVIWIDGLSEVVSSCPSSLKKLCGIFL
jgi:hypothetical protein